MNNLTNKSDAELREIFEASSRMLAVLVDKSLRSCGWTAINGQRWHNLLMNPYEVDNLEPHEPRRRLTPAQWALIVFGVLLLLRLFGVT